MWAEALGCILRESEALGYDMPPEKRNDLPGPEPTMEPEPVTLCLVAPVSSTQKPEAKGFTKRSKLRRAATIFRKVFGLRQPPCPRQAPMCNDSLVGLGAPERPAGAGGEAHYDGIATEELHYGYAGDVSRARDDSDLTVWRGVWNLFQYSSLV